VYVSNSPSAELRDCDFIDNVPRSGGGAHFHATQNLQVNRCLFRGNGVTQLDHLGRVRNEGGAVAVNSSDAVILNCVFWDSSATDGGAIFSSATDSRLVDCTFYDNLAYDPDFGCSIHYDDLPLTHPSDMILRNCIPWGDPGDLQISFRQNAPYPPRARYCIIQDGFVNGDGVSINTPDP
jgi:hypothetical protein